MRPATATVEIEAGNPGTTGVRPWRRVRDINGMLDNTPDDATPGGVPSISLARGAVSRSRGVSRPNVLKRWLLPWYRLRFHGNHYKFCGCHRHQSPHGRGTEGLNYTARTIEQQLDTERYGRPLVWFEEVASTNDEARRMAEGGAPEGTVVVAVRQTAGRGRMGRAWLSPEGGVWMTLLVRPAGPPAALMSLRCALAVCQAVEAVSGRMCRIRWPNDIILLPARRKAGGILLESRLTGNKGYVVIGIGVNASVDPSEMEPELRRIAIGISETDIRAALLLRILRELETTLYTGNVDQIRTRCDTLGRRVRVAWESGVVEGVAEDLDVEGGLVVREDNGQARTLWSCQALTEFCRPLKYQNISQHPSPTGRHRMGHRVATRRRRL